MDDAKSSLKKQNHSSNLQMSIVCLKLILSSKRLFNDIPNFPCQIGMKSSFLYMLCVEQYEKSSKKYVKPFLMITRQDDQLGFQQKLFWDAEGVHIPEIWVSRHGIFFC